MMARRPLPWIVASALALAAVTRARAGDPPAMAHEWEEVGSNHWHIKGDPSEATDATDAAEGNRGACGPGMVEVKGKMRLTEIGDELQKSTCSKWINKDFPERCAVFDETRWRALREKLTTRDMRFCIDRFEYPNRKGAYPLVYMTWIDADATCKAAGKRLCTEDEWTFACEGEDALPYPYGYVRDKDACVTDRPWRWFDPKAYGRKETLVVELDKLWQGVASGSQPRCKSPFGVYDMTGNVDEWTRSSRPGRRSILKGGYWGPVRTRCRPSTRAHGEDHAFYQQGVRCCADAP